MGGTLHQSYGTTKKEDEPPSRKESGFCSSSGGPISERWAQRDVEETGDKARLSRCFTIRRRLLSAIN